MADKSKIYEGYNLMILIPVILLISLGLLMVYSASSNLAEHRFGDSNFYLKRQFLFCAIGIAAMLVTRYVPMHPLQEDWSILCYWQASILLDASFCSRSGP